MIDLITHPAVTHFVAFCVGAVAALHWVDHEEAKEPKSDEDLLG